MNSNNLFIGNIVSFIDTEYFVELKIIKENVKLYKIGDKYIDITDIDNVDEYIQNNYENDKTKIFSSLPVYKMFVDENSLIPYSTKKLTR